MIPVLLDDNVYPALNTALSYTNDILTGHFYGIFRRLLRELNFVCLALCRHQLQHYTNQLAKDTNKYIKDLTNLPVAPTPSEQRQRKMQKERLMEDFSKSLNLFQEAQRNAASKEKASVKRARAASGLGVREFL